MHVVIVIISSIRAALGGSRMRDSDMAFLMREMALVPETRKYIRVGQSQTLCFMLEHTRSTFTHRSFTGSAIE
jgi:hypothetical protein